MLPEPNVACPNGHMTCTLERGASQGMRCRVCGATLARLDERWLSEGQQRGVQTVAPRNMPLNCKVAELQLPAHNEVDEEEVGQFIATLPLPVSLELFGVGDRRAMLVRAPEGGLRHLAGMVQAHWPSAILKILDEDPVNASIAPPGGAMRFDFGFRLQKEPYLPIRTWVSFLHGDPMHSLLAATQGLGKDEKVWLQVLLVRKSVPAWLSKVQQRLKMEEQRGFMMGESGNIATQTPTFTYLPISQGISSARGIAYVLAFLFGFIAFMMAWQEQWAVFGVMVVIGLVVGMLWTRFFKGEGDTWRGADLKLVSQKVVNQDSFYQAAVRASVWAETVERARELAHRIENCMGQYGQAGGNAFVGGPDSLDKMGAWPVQLVREEERWMWLGPDEVAGLWHPPIVNERVSPGLVPVRGVEIRSPDPEDVEGFYEIGRYFTPDGGSKPVRICGNALEHNIFCIGKPGAGKSTLMQHLVLAGMRDEERPAVIVVDPHGDLVNQLMGTIEPGDAERIRILDVGDQEYSMTFNPLDVHREGWTVVQVANSIVDIGRSLWSDYWGPRMQNPLKRGVQLLAAANELRPEDACLGLSQLAAVLTADTDVRRQFIANELDGSQDQTMLARYFLDDYDALSKNFREQVIQPVLSKAYRFEEEPMLALFSSPQSKLDVGQIIRDRSVLVINTGMNKYGSEISDFVGSLMINVVLMDLVRQGEKSPGHRAPVMVVIDEFQTYTGVAWAHLVQQMRKYGGRMVLGTQSMASLRKQDKDIPEIILSGVYSLFAFNMNGDDADYFSKYELSGDHGGPAADTLISLEPHKAYVRLEREDGRMSRPFYFESAPPREVDELLTDRVKRLRAEYSFSYEVAHQKAMQMLTYFDRYGVAVASVGAGVSAAVRQGTMGATSTQAASVLLPATKGGTIDEGLLEQAGMPWDVGVEAEKPAEKEEDPHKIILGKEIVDQEWDSFMTPIAGLSEDEAKT
jgi:hypothetical protein